MLSDKLLEIILYIAPGFLFLEIYRAVYPVKKSSNFSTSVWSIIYGTLIYFIVSLIDKNILHNYLTCDNSTTPNPKFTITLFCFAFILGYSRVLWHFIRFKLANNFTILKWLNPDPQSIWAKINKIKDQQWAIVFLDDNSIFLGYISEFSYDPNAKDNDFLLSKAKKVDENLKEIYIVDGKGVYLNTRNVKRIEFLNGVK